MISEEEERSSGEMQKELSCEGGGSVRDSSSCWGGVDLSGLEGGEVALAGGGWKGRSQRAIQEREQFGFKRRRFEREHCGVEWTSNSRVRGSA